MNTHEILNQDTNSKLFLGDPETIEGNKVEKVFTTGSILSKILKKLEAKSVESREGWAQLMDWTDATSVFSGLLPQDFLVESAKDQSLVDPFRSVKQCFPPSYNSDINTLEKAVLVMHKASGRNYTSDHLTLLEVLEDSKLSSPIEVQKFSLLLMGE
jgi:hypothetical protein